MKPVCSVALVLTLSGLTDVPCIGARSLPPPLVAVDTGDRYEETIEIFRVVAADIDGDGIAEIVVETHEGAQFAQHYLNIWEWDGNRFVRQWRKSGRELQGTEVLSIYIHGLAAGDFDGDGKQEIAVQMGDDLFCIEWSGKQYRQKWRSEVKAGLLQQTADVDGNGSSDLIAGASGDTQCVISLREGKFVKVWESPNPPVGVPRRLISGVLSASEEPRLILSSSEVGKMLWQLYTVQGWKFQLLAQQVWNVSEIGFYAVPHHIADFDRNRTTEILVLAGMREEKGKEWVHRNFWSMWQWLSSGLKLLAKSPVWENHADRSGFMLASSKVGDVDGDGKLDIISVLFDYNTKPRTGMIKILNWDGKKFVETWEHRAGQPFIQDLVVEAIGDVNGYGKNEIICSGAGKVLIYRCRKVAEAIEVVSPSGKQGEVWINETPVFFLRAKIKGMNPHERAKLVANRLDRLLEQDLRADEVSVKEHEGTWCIMARKEILVTISTTEAKAHKIKPKELAFRWAQALKKELRG